MNIKQKFEADGKTMKYKIERFNRQGRRSASSMKDAVSIAREWLGVDRVYRGATYVTDQPKGDDRETVNALDVWRSRRAANIEQSTCADAVISWV